MTDQGAAEEAMRALARDLLEEVVAARTVALASEQDEATELDLSMFNIRGFQRVEHTRSGRTVVENVRPHAESRMGLPGHVSPGASPEQAAKEQAWEKHGEQVWKENEWKKRAGAIQSLHSGIGKTRDAIAPVKPEERYDSKGHGKPENEGRDTFNHFISYGADSRPTDYLRKAQESLGKATASKDDREAHGEHVADAYEHLANAHRVTTEKVLPQAQTANAQKLVRKSLDGIKGHMEALDKMVGAGGATTKAVTEGDPYSARRAKALTRAAEGVGDINDRLLGNGEYQKSRDLNLWGPHDGEQAVWVPVGKAWGSLRDAVGGDKEALGSAYQGLAEAHRVVVEHVLPRVHGDQAKTKDVQDVLSAIQEQMEALDKVAGTKSDTTKKILGTSAQHAERAKSVREGVLNDLMAAAEAGDEDRVDEIAERDYKLLDPGDMDAALKRVGQVAKAKADNDVYLNHGIKPGDRVSMQQGHTKFTGTSNGVTESATDKKSVRVKWDNGETTSVDPKFLQAEQPEYPRGAAAVHPGVGAHARAAMPGGTLSGHENKNFAQVQQQPVQPASPVDAELGQLKQQVGTYAQREADRRQSDLDEHLKGIHAAEAERLGQAAEGEYKPLSDQEFSAHLADVDRAVERALHDFQSTADQHSMDGDGQVWTPERTARHAEILRDFAEQQANVPEDRQALVIGGPAGAGKSSFQEDSSVNLSQYAPVNADYFKEELARRGMVPEVAGLSPMESAALIRDESVYLAKLATEEMIDQGKNIAWETTMQRSGRTKAWVQNMQDEGYRVHGVLVNVPIEVSADRVASRYRKGLEAYRKGTDPLGGRYIPRSIVLQGEWKPGKTAAGHTFVGMRNAGDFDSWEVHDGTRPLGHTQTRSSEGGHKPSGPGISSVEKLHQYKSGTEQAAKAAESGQQAEEEAGNAG